MAEKEELEPQEESPVSKPAPAGNRTKVTKMTLKDVEAAISKARSQMGGLQSRYGQSLIAQRERLSRKASSAVQVKKAA